MAYQITGITRDNTSNVVGSVDVFLLKYNSSTHLFTQIAHVVSDSSAGTFAFTGIADNDPAYNIVAFKDGTPHSFDVSDRSIVPILTAVSGVQWNSLDMAGSVTLSNGNLTMLTTTAGGGVRTTTSHTTGKYYIEFAFDVGAGGLASFIGIVGFALVTASLSAATAMDNPANMCGLRLNAGTEFNGTGDGASLAAVPVGKVVGLALDLNARKNWWISDEPSGWGSGANWQSGFVVAESVDAGAHSSPWADTAMVTGAPAIFLYACGLANSNTFGVTLRSDGLSSVGITVPTGYGNAW